MTKRLFDEDVMRSCCDAVVTDCIALKDGFGIELDQTVFYPEGGGQLSDVGKLRAGDKSLVVGHVREKDGRIFHETKEAMPIGTRVEAAIDWQERFDHMQQHCGEHLLSYAFWKLCGAENIGFHMSPDMVTIDLSHEVTAEEIARAEQLANEHIQSDRPLRTAWMEAEQAAQKATRKFNDKLTGAVRVVAIEGSDACTCCGTHPPRTGMVGLVKIFKAEKHKQGTRIHFLCGRLALEKINRCWQNLTAAAQLLSIKEEAINEGVTRLQAENSELRSRIVGLEKEWAVERAGQLLAGTEIRNGVKDILVQAENLSADAARALAQELAQDTQVQATIFYADKGRLNYILIQGAAVDGSCRKRIAAVNELLNGRGGGKDNQAQGSAPLQDNWQSIVGDAFL